MPEAAREWSVQEVSRSSREVRAFFRELSRVPAPEPYSFDTVYVVTVEEETVGMAVVDTFSRPCLTALGVVPDHREQGIGTALVERCLEAHDRLHARVRKDNDPAIALCESVGLEQHESMWPHELWSYEAPEDPASGGGQEGDR